VGARGDGWWLILDSTDPTHLLAALHVGPHPSKLAALEVLKAYRLAVTDLQL
jgi:hypothetical protein